MQQSSPHLIPPHIMCLNSLVVRVERKSKARKMILPSISRNDKNLALRLNAYLISKNPLSAHHWKIGFRTLQ